MSSATSPTVCFIIRSVIFFALSPDDGSLETQFPPFSTNPPLPPTSRVTGFPQCGHFSSGGSVMRCSFSNSPHFPHLYSYVGTFIPLRALHYPPIIAHPATGFRGHSFFFRPSIGQVSYLKECPSQGDATTGRCDRVPVPRHLLPDLRKRPRVCPPQGQIGPR